MMRSAHDGAMRFNARAQAVAGFCFARLVFADAATLLDVRVAATTPVDAMKHASAASPRHYAPAKAQRATSIIGH